jgi:hypothetical protein
VPVEENKMADDNNTDVNNNPNPDNTPPNPPETPPTTTPAPAVPPGNKEDEDLVQKIVKSKVEEALQPIKENLDKAYKARNEALAKLAEFEQREKEAKLQQLKDEGKHREVWDIEKAELNARLEAAERRNTELSRDVAVKDALKSYSFRNDKASEMAFKEITANLVKDENGQWKHRSGISIKDYCDAFSKDEDQAFLFKAKTNSGAGTPSGTANSPGPANTGSNSIFKMSQAEVLKRAAEGTLPNTKRK